MYHIRMNSPIRLILRNNGTIALNYETNVIPDYMKYAGNERKLIKVFQDLLTKRQTNFSWIDKDIGLIPDKRILVIAADTGLLFKENGNRITLHKGECKAEFKGCINNEDFIFSLLIKGTGKKISMAFDGAAIAGDELYGVDSTKKDIEEAIALEGKKVSKDSLPMFLSVFLSRTDSIPVSIENYEAICRKPIEAIPTLSFLEVDEYGYLRVMPYSAVEGLNPEAMKENDISSLVRINEHERILEIRDIVFTEDPAGMLRNIIGKKNGRYIYEENGIFVLDGQFAKQFISRNLSKLIKSFKLNNAGVLAIYKIRYSRPKAFFHFPSEIDFLDGKSYVEIGDQRIGILDFISSYSEDDDLVSLKDGSKAYVDSAFIKELQRLVKIKGNKAVISPFDIPFMDQREDFIVTGKEAERISSFYSGLGSINRKDYETRISTSKLRQYQVEGYKWLRYLHDAGMGGCLADEMGLGKTIQIIALLNDVSSKRYDKPSLLIVPKSLIHNWVCEIGKFGTGLRTFIYYGQTRNIGQIRMLSGGIIISSYATIRNDISQLREISFDYVIIDEAQMIRNFSTSTSKAVSLLKSEHRIAISGTPIENNPGELFSLFRFLNPSIFPSLSDFNRDYAKPIMNDDEEAIRELKVKIHPFILRRMKKDVLAELPTRTDQTIYIDMDEEQWQYYERRRMELKSRVKEEISSKGTRQSAFAILQALTELRQIAALPGYKMGTCKTSAKREYLKQVIPGIIESNHKILIFTSFLEAVEEIGEDLNEMGIGFVTMTGATRDRNNLVSEFQTDPDIKVFIMTLKTGGVGLNLTAADYVFIFDPWWNAAEEEQAINRIHRIGQENPVFCYRLISRNTIEEKIEQLQKNKIKISSSIINSDYGILKSITNKEIEELLE